jgi:predicted ferric reductase
MDVTLIIAIVALIVSILARPIEMLWDYFFKDWKGAINKLFDAFIFTVLYILPPVFFIYVFNIMKVKVVDKEFITYACGSTLLLAMMTVRVMLRTYVRRIDQAQDDIDFLHRFLRYSGIAKHVFKRSDDNSEPN